MNTVCRYFPAAISRAPSTTTLQLRLDPKTVGTQQRKLDFIPFSCSNRESHRMTSRDPAYVGHFASRGSAILLPIVFVASLEAFCLYLHTCYLLGSGFTVIFQGPIVSLGPSIISILYMFRATPCSSSGESIVSIQH